MSALYFAISWYFSSQTIIADRDQNQVDTIIKRNQNESRATDGKRDLVYEKRHNNFYLIETPELDAQLWHFKRADPTKCAVIFSHGWGGTRASTDKFQKAFIKTACDFIGYDLRGHGLHPKRYSTGGIQEKKDLLDIHAFLKKDLGLEDKQLAWFGLSLGASLSLQAAATGLTPSFIVADSPFQSWEMAIFERGVERYGTWVEYFKPGLRLMIYLRTGVNFTDANVLEVAENIKSPVLLMHSRTDKATSSVQSEEIFKRLKKDRAVFHHTDWGAAHGKDIDVDAERYEALVHLFLEQFAPHFLAAD